MGQQGTSIPRFTLVMHGVWPLIHYLDCDMLSQSLRIIVAFSCTQLTAWHQWCYGFLLTWSYCTWLMEQVCGLSHQWCLLYLQQGWVPHCICSRAECLGRGLECQASLSQKAKPSTVASPERYMASLARPFPSLPAQRHSATFLPAKSVFICSGTDGTVKVLTTKQLLCQHQVSSVSSTPPVWIVKCPLSCIRPQSHTL